MLLPAKRKSNTQTNHHLDAMHCVEKILSLRIDSHSRFSPASRVFLSLRRFARTCCVSNNDHANFPHDSLIYVDNAAIGFGSIWRNAGDYAGMSSQIQR